MSNELRAALDDAQAALARVDPDDAAAAVPVLREAAEHVERAFNEAIAANLLDGRSIRQVGADAGLAPNSIPPRLAATRLLGAYSTDGRVSGDGIAAARFEAQRAGRPMRFTRRRPARLSGPDDHENTSTTPEETP